MSPICSIMVASEIGTMVMMAVTTRPQSGLLNTAKAVFSQLKGIPTHFAACTPLKSTWPKQAAMRYEPMTPSSTGMIRIMPLPHMLQTMMIRVARRAIQTLAMQLLMADPESVRPMAMMIGPVTTGGK